MEEADVTVSFVIPCYRSTIALKSVVSELTLRAREDLDAFEIILVQDSTDEATSALLGSLEREFQETVVVRLSRNFGQQAATLAGIHKSVGEVVVTLDDDNQHRPADAFVLIKFLAENPHVALVYGSSAGRSDSRVRARTGRIYRNVLSRVGLGHADYVGPFRAFRGYLRGAFTAVRGPNVAIDVILNWVADGITTVPCDFNVRRFGESGYTPRKLLALATATLISYTTKPLMAGVYLGVFGITVGIVYGFFITLSYIFGGVSVPGFAATTLLILFMGSLQLLILGIIGIYLGDQHKRLLAEPAYLEVIDR